MWILPKQLHTCHSVQVMTESESDLKEFSQTCEQSLMWRSKPSQSQTWFRRWKANSWMQHLSTRMLRPSHTKNFVEEWTSYQEASLVNPLAKLELEKELKTLDIYTHTSVEESKNVNQELFSSKTLKELSQAKQQKENQFSTMCLKTWKDWVTEQRQEYSQRVKSASHIREKESSSWATPRASATDSTRPNGKGGIPLAQQAKNWSTPTTSQITRQMDASQLKRNSLSLAQQAEVNDKNWATPNTMDMLPPKDYNASMKQAQGIRKNREKPSNLREQVNPESVQAYKDAMNYPTPRTSDAEGGRIETIVEDGTFKSKRHKSNQTFGAKLRDAVETFPTPTARDWKDTPGTKTFRDMSLPKMIYGCKKGYQGDQIKNNTNGKSLELNPSWVEQLMGLQVGWTDLDFSEME